MITSVNTCVTVIILDYIEQRHILRRIDSHRMIPFDIVEEDSDDMNDSIRV